MEHSIYSYTKITIYFRIKKLNVVFKLLDSCECSIAIQSWGWDFNWTRLKLEIKKIDSDSEE